MSDAGRDTAAGIARDLTRWLAQNDDTGLDFYLDEGAPPALPLPPTVRAATPIAPGAASGSTPPAPGAAPPAPSAGPPAAQPPAPSSGPPAAQPAADGDDFAQTCDVFVAETLRQIERQHKIRPLIPRGEPLLAQTGGDRAAALDLLRAEVVPCTSCGLAQTRTHTVFGAGAPDAGLVFIGEAPGRDEDLQGEPFVGRSGQLLTRILAAIDFARDDVFICNILKCRPPNNRDPQPDEVAVCEPHLKRQLAIIQPRLICCLGRVAAQTLLGTKASLKALRETVHFYEGIPVLATFHPAALLRNPHWKRDTWDDVRKLKALYDALPGS